MKAEEKLAKQSNDATTIVVVGAKVYKRGKHKGIWFNCEYTDGDEPGQSPGAAVFEEAPSKVIGFLRDNKEFAKPCLCFTGDPEVERLSAEHDVESAATAEKKEAAKKKV